MNFYSKIFKYITLRIKFGKTKGADFHINIVSYLMNVILTMNPNVFVYSGFH